MRSRLRAGLIEGARRLNNYRLRNRRLFAPVFFLAGFGFDILRLRRIDDPLSIARQILFLIALGTVLSLEFLAREGAFSWKGTRLEKVEPLLRPMSQFLFGSLLAGYAIFYFKSASVFSSIGFVAVLCGLVVFNEATRFKGSAIPTRFALYALCLASFFSFLSPMIMGRLGTGPFEIGMAAAAVILLGNFGWVYGRSARRWDLVREMLLPCTVVLAAFVGLYLRGWIPPVPVSAQYLGIFHGVERDARGYRLLEETPWWKFWMHGDQRFLYREGDRIYLFARIFAPRSFREEVRVRWQRYEGHHGWVDWDVIPITVLGGREDGFRGYAFKDNYEAGFWRVKLEAEDGREISRLYFQVLPDPSSDVREYRVEYQ